MPKTRHALIFLERKLEMNNLVSDFHLILSKKILILLLGILELLPCKRKIAFKVLVLSAQVFDFELQRVYFIL